MDSDLRYVGFASGLWCFGLFEMVIGGWMLEFCLWRWGGVCGGVAVLSVLLFGWGFYILCAV